MAEEETKTTNEVETASEPIPVNPIDPTSFLQGWLVGRRLAGMRK